MVGMMNLRLDLLLRGFLVFGMASRSFLNSCFDLFLRGFLVLCRFVIGLALRVGNTGKFEMSIGEVHFPVFFGMWLNWMLELFNLWLFSCHFVLLCHLNMRWLSIFMFWFSF